MKKKVNNDFKTVMADQKNRLSNYQSNPVQKDDVFKGRVEHYAASVIDAYNIDLQYHIVRKYSYIHSDNTVNIVVRLLRGQSFYCPDTFRICIVYNIQAYTLLYISFIYPKL